MTPDREKELVEPCDFDDDFIDGVARTWPHYEAKLSPLEREQIISEAKMLTGALFDAMHSATGWCGDIWDANFRAAWPLVAIALCLARADGEKSRTLKAALSAALPLIAREVLEDMKAWYETFPETCGFSHGLERYATEHNIPLSQEGK